MSSFAPKSGKEAKRSKPKPKAKPKSAAAKLQASNIIVPAHLDLIVESVKTGLSVELQRTESPIVIKGGYGGHPLAARPKKAALTVYEGRQPFTMEAPMILYSGGASVYADRKTLEGFAAAPFGGTNAHAGPPRVRFGGSKPAGDPSSLPPEAVGKLWWLEDLAWGKEYRSDDFGLYYVEVTGTFLEAINDETLKEQEPPSKKNSHRRYIVQAGDKLHTIAAKAGLGSGSKGVAELKKANHIRSDGQLAKLVGREIIIPS